jgi:hypothetical protein
MSESLLAPSAMFKQIKTTQRQFFHVVGSGVFVGLDEHTFYLVTTKAGALEFLTVSYQCHMSCDEWRQRVNKDRKEKVNLTTPI